MTVDTEDLVEELLYGSDQEMSDTHEDAVTIESKMKHISITTDLIKSVSVTYFSRTNKEKCETLKKSLHRNNTKKKKIF
jgi:hypothetical protein